MRICHVLTDDRGGGIVYAAAVARGAGALGAEIDWMFTGSEHIQSRAGRNRIREACARADVVHCHGFRSAMLVAPFSRRLVVTPHGSHLLRRTRGPRRWAAQTSVRAAARRAAAVICVGSDELSELERVLGRDAAKLRLILNGSKRVPLPTSEDRRVARNDFGLDDRVPVLAFIARLESHKDPLLAVRSFEHALGRLPTARLLVAGDGVLEQSIRELAVPGVRLLGQLSDTNAVLVASDAVLNTALWEGMSLTLLEASWRGRPAIAVDAPGNREAVADTGVLVASRDVRQIGDAIAALLADRERLALLGRRARERAELLFDEERMVALTLDVYEDVLQAAVATAGARGSAVEVGAR